MLFALLFAYFLIVAFAVVLTLYPTRRTPVAAAAARRVHDAIRGLQQAADSGRSHANGLWSTARHGTTSLLSAAAEHRNFVIASVTVAVLPPLVVLALPHRPLFELVGTEPMPDHRIASLLAGEQLAPPPTLPPEIFATTEVELVSPSIAWASRDWDLLDDHFRRRLLAVFRLLKEQHGYDAVLLEGYRSAERQAELALRGPAVTRAAPNMSYHQYGLAADVAFLRDGKLVISERDPWAMRGYRHYGELAEAAGLTWGGRWELMDFGHVELRRPGVIPDERS